MLDGLHAGDLRRPVLPSGWHCLGLLHHWRSLWSGSGTAQSWPRRSSMV
ncbi:hypothetical protein [Streptomyces sp. Vc74B-19]